MSELVSEKYKVMYSMNEAGCGDTAVEALMDLCFQMAAKGRSSNDGEPLGWVHPEKIAANFSFAKYPNVALDIDNGRMNQRAQREFLRLAEQEWWYAVLVKRSQRNE